MHAVILTGGKQYRVKEGDVLSVEKLAGEPGEQVYFDRILLLEDGNSVLIGTPVLEGAVVRAEILETYKDDKVIVFKKKRRKQYRRTKGHRQHLTKIRVDGIAADKGSLPAQKAKPKKAAPAEAKPLPEKAEPGAKPRAAKKAKPAAKAVKKAVKAAPKKAEGAKKTAAKSGPKPRKKSKE